MQTIQQIQRNLHMQQVLDPVALSFLALLIVNPLTSLTQHILTTPNSSKNGTCSATYCHSDGTNATVYTTSTATWGGAASCDLCHKTDTAINTPASGYGHAKHVTAGVSGAIGCVKCHAATVSNNTTISNISNHVDLTNKTVTIRFNRYHYRR